MWREKYIKIAWGVFALNASISLLQSFFAYGHYIKQEYWMMALSVFFFLFNGFFAYKQIVNIKQIKQDLKDYMWQTLSTPSELLR